MGMISCAKGCHVVEESSPRQQASGRWADQNYQCSAGGHLSKSMSLSSQSSLGSLPSLDLHQQRPSTLHHCVLTLCGHSSYVSAIAADGASLYSGSSDGEIRSWRLGITCDVGSGGDDGGAGGYAGQVVAVRRSAVKALVVSRGRLFGAYQDRRIHVWQISHQRETSHAGNYRLAATLPTAGDRLLSLLSPESYVEVRRHKKCTWVHHVDAVSALALSHDGALLFSASWDRTFKVWRTSDGKCLESVADAHHDAVNAIVVSRDGTAYTGSADTTVKVWRRLPGETKHSLAGTLERHRSAVNALALSPDGSVLYSGACDRSVVVWEGGGGGSSGGGSSSTPMVVAGALRGHTKAVLCLATVGELVCSGSADRSARVWRRGLDKSYSCLAVLEGHRAPVKCLAAAVGGEMQEDEADACGGVFHTIYTGSLDCDIKVWRVYAPFLQQFAE
ncbi:hypothetical protein Taro_030194 [Colocasia esculenta]|uniref:Uncharacterized protein n=1 Tax=Colocasia esculenta TaxID=4460 RepID=A0A843VFQ7_COLES|nr:hypothetical protein [Colocasia esculenta]